MAGNDKRSFHALKEDGSALDLTIRKPSRGELEFADIAYSKSYNLALKNGLPTRTRQLKDIRSAGQWTDDDEIRLEATRKEAAGLEAQIADGKLSEDDRKAIEDKRQIALRNFNEQRRDVEAMLSHTCDARADNAYRNTLIACVIEYSPTGTDGKPINLDKQTKVNDLVAMRRVWQSVDELMGELDRTLLQRVVYEHTMFQAGLPSDWRDEPAEAPAEPPVVTPPVTPVNTEPPAGSPVVVGTGPHELQPMTVGAQLAAAILAPATESPAADPVVIAA